MQRCRLLGGNVVHRHPQVGVAVAIAGVPGRCAGGQLRRRQAHHPCSQDHEEGNFTDCHITTSCYCERRISICPMVVRSRRIGPPPFSCPSPNIAFGPYCPPSDVIASPWNSDFMPGPLAISVAACTLTPRSRGRYTTIFPRAVCREESPNWPGRATNCTVMGPPPVST